MGNLSQQIGFLQELFREGSATGLSMEAQTARRFLPALAAMKEEARLLESRQPVPVGLAEPLPTDLRGLRFS